MRFFPKGRPRSLARRVRVKALLLMLPLVGVAVVAGVGRLVTDGIANSVNTVGIEAGQLSGLRDDVQTVALTGLSYLAEGGAAHQEAFETSGARVATDLQAWGRLADRTAAQAAVFAELKQSWSLSAPTRAAVSAVSSTASSGRTDAPVLQDALTTAIQMAVADVARLQAINATQLSALNDERADAERAAVVVVLVAIVMGLLGALLVARRLTASVLRPVSVLEAESERMAAGDLTHRVKINGDQEFNRLGAAFNHMADQVATRDETLQGRERRLAALLENASDGILVIARDGAAAYATPAFSTDYVGAHGRTADLGELTHPDDRERAGRAWRRVISGGLGSGEEVEARIRHRDGTWHHVWGRFTNRLDDPDVCGVVLNMSDVSERHEYEDKLSYQALHDPLTGLANRELFRQRLQRTALVATGTDASISLLYLDIDDFKEVNDSLGHDAGDLALAVVAQRLVACVRPGDTVARLGGDEFGILLPRARQRDAVIAAERIAKECQQPFTVKGKEMTSTLSIGIASAKSASAQPDTLLADADLAMYFAKRGGKGHHAIFAPPMRASFVERLQLGEDLRAAVASGRIEVHYQPIVALKTQSVVAVEALARWRHETRGWIPPDTFIPLAEELGIVGDIDAMVLRQACQQGQAWRAAGLPELRVAVNLSGRNLEDAGLVKRVTRTLLETGFPAASLELELTEGVSIAESARAHSVLDGLHRIGLHLAIDDFGTGYSALGRLRSLPFDRLKVDKSFVDELGGSHDSPTLLETILEMAHVLGLQVVAEGIELPAQAEFLRQHGCDFGQGYLFSRPLAPADITAFIAQPQPTRLAV